MSYIARLLAMLVFPFLAVLDVTVDASPDDAPLRPTVSTPLKEHELLEVLRVSHVSTFGHEPSEHRLAMAWAQVAFENGRGEFVYNHNIGNTWCDGSCPHYVVGGNQTYKSYNTFDEGATAYWQTINNCAAASHAFDWGTATAAAEALKLCNYFNADPETYAMSMTSLFYSAKVLIAKQKIDGGTHASSD